MKVLGRQLTRGCYTSAYIVLSNFVTYMVYYNICVLLKKL